MRALLGIDEEQRNGAERTPAEDLLQRLRFTALTGVEAVHVLAPSVYIGYDMGGYVSPQTLMKERDAARAYGAEVLHHVAERWADSGICRCQTALLEGNAVELLLERAEATAADLIAVNGSRRSEPSALLVGSVVRSLLAHAFCSLLIAKQHILCDPAPPLRVVLATDHSDYANRCIERLLAFGPLGIRELTVVCAYPADRLRSFGARVASPTVDLAEAVRTELERKNEVLIERLRSDGLGTDVRYASLVIAGSEHEVIDVAMREAGADLLVLGARGHGFVERVVLGSVSYREAVTSPHSVLVLRC